MGLGNERGVLIISEKIGSRASRDIQNRIVEHSASKPPYQTFVCLSLLEHCAYLPSGNMAILRAVGHCRVASFTARVLTASRYKYATLKSWYDVTSRVIPSYSLSTRL